MFPSASPRQSRVHKTCRFPRSQSTSVNCELLTKGVKLKYAENSFPEILGHKILGTPSICLLLPNGSSFPEHLFELDDD